MKSSVFFGIVISVTILCILVVTRLSGDAELIFGVLVFSVIPSIPIYILRKRYERSVSDILEHREREKPSSEG
jgi:hypothetical protein